MVIGTFFSVLQAEFTIVKITESQQNLTRKEDDRLFNML